MTCTLALLQTKDWFVGARAFPDLEVFSGGGDTEILARSLWRCLLSFQKVGGTDLELEATTSYMGQHLNGLKWVYIRS